MQAKNISAESFSQRTDELAQRLGISLRGLCEVAGISQPMFFGYRSGKHVISTKALKKITDLEHSKRLNLSDTVEETPAPYGVQAVAKHRMILNPAYATPPSAPTRAQIEARVRDYLDAAERVPGGLGYAWGQIATHLNPHSLDALKIEA